MGSKSHSLDVKTLLLLSLHHDLFSAMDVHARLRRPSAYLEALEGVPVGVVVIVSSDGADTCQQAAQVDDVWLPRRADVVVADIHQRVVDVDNLAVDTGAQRHGLRRPPGGGVYYCFVSFSPVASTYSPSASVALAVPV